MGRTTFQNNGLRLPNLITAAQIVFGEGQGRLIRSKILTKVLPINHFEGEGALNCPGCTNGVVTGLPNLLRADPGLLLAHPVSLDGV